jgi:hypothetical protein
VATMPRPRNAVEDHISIYCDLSLDEIYRNRLKLRTASSSFKYQG